MTQYAILIYGDEKAFTDQSPEAWAAMMDAHRAFSKAVGDLGATILGGEALGLSDTATSIRDGVVTDGPFVETKEFLAGFWIIEAPDLDVALKLAAEGSKACNRKVEVRPLLGE
jgi:hypothetical protein